MSATPYTDTNVPQDFVEVWRQNVRLIYASGFACRMEYAERTGQVVDRALKEEATQSLGHDATWKEVGWLTSDFLASRHEQFAAVYGSEGRAEIEAAVVTMKWGLALAKLTTPVKVDGVVQLCERLAGYFKGDPVAQGLVGAAALGKAILDLRSNPAEHDAIVEQIRELFGSSPAAAIKAPATKVIGHRSDRATFIHDLISIPEMVHRDVQCIPPDLSPRLHDAWKRSIAVPFARGWMLIYGRAHEPDGLSVLAKPFGTYNPELRNSPGLKMLMSQLTAVMLAGRVLLSYAEFEGEYAAACSAADQLSVEGPRFHPTDMPTGMALLTATEVALTGGRDLVVAKWRQVAEVCEQKIGPLPMVLRNAKKPG